MGAESNKLLLPLAGPAVLAPGAWRRPWPARGAIAVIGIVGQPVDQKARGRPDPDSGSRTGRCAGSLAAPAARKSVRLGLGACPPKRPRA